MSPDFKPPLSESEFRRRSEGVTVPAASAVIRSLKARRVVAVKPLDEEIAFYEKIIAQKTEEFS